MKTIYLCGPINGRSDSDCREWRDRAKALWVGYTLDPMRRDYRGREHECAAEIVAKDIEDIRMCDGVLVYFDKPSVGTAMEVYIAATMGKPVVVIDASDKPLSPWLTHHATHITKGMREALRLMYASLHD